MKRKKKKKKKKVGTDQENAGLLMAEDLRTSAKAMQTRMWKIEFTKQLAIELIYIPCSGKVGGGSGSGRRERERESKPNGVE